jgi:DNA-binding MarR family transcriptional regulator
MDDPATTPPTLTARSAFLLSRTGKAARALVADGLAVRGARMPLMAVLAALADFGPHVQRELGARLAMDPSDVTKVVEELAAHGYVERARDERDRRRVSVALTAEGRAALAGMDAAVAEAEDALLAPLSGDERAALASMLERVYAAAAVRRRADAVPLTAAD